MKREAGPWSCNISLRFRYDSFGNEISEPSSIPFGPTLTSPNGVELILKRAQAAILNPHETAARFLTKNEKDLQNYKTDEAFQNGSLKFSKNAVCVEIRDPDAVNLSFVDLPGKSLSSVRALLVYTSSRSYFERRAELHRPRGEHGSDQD